MTGTVRLHIPDSAAFNQRDLMRHDESSRFDFDDLPWDTVLGMVIASVEDDDALEALDEIGRRWEGLESDFAEAIRNVEGGSLLNRIE